MIYVVEDDKSIRNLVDYALTEKGYEVETFEDGLDITDIIKEKGGQLLILDIMLPEKDGLEILEEIREFSDIPIILLTARTEEYDKVLGLESGADDYITKPFSINELRARVAAHIRRERREKHNRLVDYPISCDLLNRKFYTYENEINLTKSEYEICVLLLKNKGQVFSKEYIYTTIYGYDADGDSKSSITERIKQIRSKFVEHKLDPIKTVWGVGYKWEIENL